MLLSDRHKFAFFHSPKTGGSSITHALAPYVNQPRSPIPDDDHRGWQMYHHVGGMHTPVSRCLPLLRNRRDYVLGAVARSPWSKMVCVWHYGCWFLRPPRSRARIREAYQPPREGIDPSFGDFVRGWPHPQLSKYNFTWDQVYFLDRLDALNFIGKFEHLERSFQEFCALVGLPECPHLPHRLQRETIKPWEEYYREDPECVNLVANIYKEDVQRLGYEPPEV